MQGPTLAGIAPGDVHRVRPAVDGRLIARIAHGDVAAFETLYDRLAGTVLGFARTSAACGPTAERAVAQSFVAVWRRAEEYDGLTDALAWVTGVCRDRIAELCPPVAPTEA